MNKLVIEVPKNSYIKQQGTMMDRYLDLPFVQNYGFISDSAMQPDGDRADFFLISRSIYPSQTVVDSSILKCIGVIRYIDKGQRDDKYLFISKHEFNLVGDLVESQKDVLYVYDAIGRIINHLHMYKSMTTVNTVQCVCVENIRSSKTSEHYVNVLKNMYNVRFESVNMDQRHTNYSYNES